MWDLVGNPKDRFSCNTAHFTFCFQITIPPLLYMYMDSLTLILHTTLQLVYSNSNGIVSKPTLMTTIVPLLDNSPVYGRFGSSHGVVSRPIPMATTGQFTCLYTGIYSMIYVSVYRDIPDDSLVNTLE